jgi:uncharacterized protein involved in exopolysaccharide biosynthesis
VSVVVKRRRFVSRFVVGVTVGAVVVALLMPKWYKATASVFPAEKADLFGGLEGVSSIMKSFSPARALTSLTGSSETDRYIAILKSGTVISAVIEKFDLVKVYEITSYPMEKTAKELMSNVDISVETEGNLTVTVYDKDPQRAADMANYFIEMLNKTNTELQVQNARGNRGFIEERYKKNLVDLRGAEDSLKVFQQRYGVIALPEQTEASIKAGAEIAGRLASMEIQEAILKRTQAEDNPQVLAARIEIEELRKKMGDLNVGRGMSQDELKVFVPFRKMPELGAEYIRRYRSVEIQYKILQFVAPLFEQAKVEERRQTPSVLVLDRAGPAERKAKPRVMLYALIALVGSTVLAGFIILSLELLESLRAADPGRLEEWIRVMRQDWFGLRFRSKGR